MLAKTLGRFCGLSGHVLSLVLMAQVSTALGQIDLSTSKRLVEPVPGSPQRLNSLPMTAALSPDGRYLAVVNAGYGTFESRYQQSIAVLDIQVRQGDGFSRTDERPSGCLRPSIPGWPSVRTELTSMRSSTLSPRLRGSIKMRPATPSPFIISAMVSETRELLPVPCSNWPWESYRIESGHPFARRHSDSLAGRNRSSPGNGRER